MIFSITWSIDHFKDQLSTSAHYLVIALVISVSLLVGILIYYLAKSGWNLRNLKKIKLGPVEAEKSDSGSSTTSRPSSKGGISIDKGTVTIRESHFQGDTGDIGGVIIKDTKMEHETSDQE